MNERVGQKAGNTRNKRKREQEGTNKEEIKKAKNNSTNKQGDRNSC
jgi:hypothetical protein